MKMNAKQYVDQMITKLQKSIINKFYDKTEIDNKFDILERFTLKDNKIAYGDSILITEEDIKALKIPAENIIVSVNENGVSSKKTLQEVIDLLLNSSNVKPPSESAIVTVACGEGHCGEAYCGE